jgi:molybdenum cofactor biosynthesis enzyme MoaA
MKSSWTDRIEFKHKTCMNKYSEQHDIEENTTSLYIVLTRQCNVKCRFCEFRQGSSEIDINKFQQLLSELREHCYINTVHFTGGEPTLELDKIIQICDIVKQGDKLTKTSVNTNGTMLDRLTNISNLDNIALSRHHYKDELNSEIFQSNLVPTLKDIENSNEKQKIHVSCNLIKGYIDSRKEIINYLDCLGSIGINDIGLVSLMNINNYCDEHFVDFNNLQLELDNRITKTKYFRNIDDYTNEVVCKCDNYLYTTSNLRAVSVYHRYAVGNSKIADYLVYENNHIKQGFSGEILV